LVANDPISAESGKDAIGGIDAYLLLGGGISAQPLAAWWGR
jgi:hypothetical protein